MKPTAAQKRLITRQSISILTYGALAMQPPTAALAVSHDVDETRLRGAAPDENCRENWRVPPVGGTAAWFRGRGFGFPSSDGDLALT